MFSGFWKHSPGVPGDALGQEHDKDWHLSGDEQLGRRAPRGSGLPRLHAEAEWGPGRDQGISSSCLDPFGRQLPENGHLLGITLYTSMRCKCCRQENITRFCALGLETERLVGWSLKPRNDAVGSCYEDLSLQLPTHLTLHSVGFSWTCASFMLRSRIFLSTCPRAWCYGLGSPLALSTFPRLMLRYRLCFRTCTLYAAF